MKKVSVIFGTRPEAIKLAPVILALKSDGNIRCRVCVTGQHREMLEQVLKVFEIVPDCDLRLMRHNQDLAEFASKAIAALGRCLQRDKPDLVLVQGDTTTAFCAALAAFYSGIPVGHVEAGLRTGNLEAPWPEEANRILIARLARLHFAPTRRNRNNLLREGVPSERIFLTGNTGIDALRYSLGRIRSSVPEIQGVPGKLMEDSGRQIVLITGHRRENMGSGFRNICKAIAGLAERFPKVSFIYPVHLNPNVKGPVTHRLGRIKNVLLLSPLPYLQFVSLMKRSALILTDSGGIQEEAASLKKPVLVMRDVTERQEAVEAGTVRIVGTDPERILRETGKLLLDARARRAMTSASNPYGDGKAARRIVSLCCKFLKNT